MELNIVEDQIEALDLSKSDSNSVMNNKRIIRNYPQAVKIEAIRRIRAGETKASVGKSMKVPESTLRGWCKAAVNDEVSSNNSPMIVRDHRRSSADFGGFMRVAAQEDSGMGAQMIKKHSRPEESDDASSNTTDEDRCSSGSSTLSDEITPTSDNLLLMSWLYQNWLLYQQLPHREC